MTATTTTTPLSPTERAAKAQQTLALKQAEHDAGDFPRQCWVKVTGRGHYAGRVGKVHSHNDLRTPQHPTIPVEIGVVFGKGGYPVWFSSGELERCRHRPDNAW